MENKGDDYKILSDTVNDGVRHITAATSTLVCSRQIDFDIIDGKVHNLAYVRAVRVISGLSAVLSRVCPQRTLPAFWPVSIVMAAVHPAQTSFHAS